jgi:hypothetical protein
MVRGSGEDTTSDTTDEPRAELAACVEAGVTVDRVLSPEEIEKWLNSADWRRFKCVVDARTSTVRDVSIGADLDIGESGAADGPPEPAYVWVKYPADELPAADGLEYVGADGEGAPVGVARSSGLPGLAKARSTGEAASRGVDADAIAAAVAEQVIAHLAEHRVENRAFPIVAGWASDAKPIAVTPGAPPVKFMKIADYARRTGYSVRTVENFLVEGLPSVGERRLRRVDVEAADEWIRGRAARDQADHDAFEEDARRDARRGGRARRGRR